MTRRRGTAFRRVAGPGGSAAAAITGWTALHQAGGLITLMLLGLAALAGWPLLVLPVFCAPAALLAGLVPRRFRAARRKALRDAGYDDRPAVPALFQRAVWAADRGRCVYCTRTGLVPRTHQRHIDHVVPWAAGGLTAAWNLMLLCPHHNLVKSNYWRERNGYVSYRPGRAGNETLAAAILAAELRERRNPLRWARMAWEMAS